MNIKHLPHLLSQYFSPDIIIDNDLNNRKGVFHIFWISILQFLIIILTFPVTFETHDEYWMNAIASGALSGEPSEYLVFMNILLGKLLAFGYKIIPQINWYTLLLLFSLFLGYFTIQFNFYRLKTDPAIRIARHLLILATLLFSLHYVGFTRTAAIVITGGFTLILMNPKKNALPELAGGALLIILGALIRFSVFKMYLVLSIPIIFILLINRKYQKLLVISIAIIISFANYAFDRNTYRSNPEYRAYIESNSLRSKLFYLDNPTLEYDGSAEMAEVVGWDENDFNLVIRGLWDHNHHKFEKEKLSELSISQNQTSNNLYVLNIISSLKVVVKSLYNHLINRYYYTIPILILFIMLGMPQGKKTQFVILSFLYVLLIAFVLFHFQNGMLKPRVLFGMILPLILFVLFQLDKQQQLPDRILLITKSTAEVTRSIILCISITALAATTLSYTSNSHKRKIDRDRSHAYQNWIAEQKEDFYIARINMNPFYIYKNPIDQTKNYFLAWHIGSPQNKQKMKKYAGSADFGIYTLFDKEIIWYFGEKLGPSETALVENFYLSNYSHCSLKKDSVMVEDKYKLLSTHFISLLIPYLKSWSQLIQLQQVVKTVIIDNSSHAHPLQQTLHYRQRGALHLRCGGHRKDLGKRQIHQNVSAILRRALGL
jgi:hypothetical protein